MSFPADNTSVSTVVSGKVEDKKSQYDLPNHKPFRDSKVSFAVDISGSTFGPTLDAEKDFIRSVSDLLSPTERFSAKILPWDDRAHPILSVAQLNRLEDRGGTDPRVLLSNASHKEALKASSLWFLMTDGLISEGARVQFAKDVATHGVHGISCVVVVFGNPRSGPASCDISVGVGVFSVVPNCAFLFCNETNGDLRVMQTKGTFDALLKGQPHAVFTADSRWDLLPQVSVADFADIHVPTPQRLGSDEVALQDSLVINMNNLFANRLAPDQIENIFSDMNNLDAVRMTMQARNQQEDFRHWLQQQTLRPDDPLFKTRQDLGNKAASLFRELADLFNRGQPLPWRLQSQLRAAYRDNMRHLVSEAQTQVEMSLTREEIIQRASASSFSPINSAIALSPSRSSRIRPPAASAPMGPRMRAFETSYSPYVVVLATPQSQSTGEPTQPPPAPGKRRSIRQNATHEREDEAWGAWETGLTDSSLRGLLYTTGFRSTRGSFKGTCPLCNVSGVPLAWLFRTSSSGPYKPPTPGPITAGFPAPGSHTRLAFPLAMGHFTETSSVLATVSGASTPLLTGSLQKPPTLVCDPCSVFYTRNGALDHGFTVALPMVRFSENREAVCRALSRGFEDRFADSDVAQVFLSVLMHASDKSGGTPKVYSATPPASLVDLDIQATMAAAAASATFRAAVEWTASDLLYSVVALRELSENFSLSSAQSAPVWPLAAVLTGAFEELEDGWGGCHHEPVEDGWGGHAQGLSAPLLRYPLPGFVTILKLAPLLKISPDIRRRAAFRRLLFLVCEDLDKAAESAPHSQNVAHLFGGLLGRPHSTGPGAAAAAAGPQWEPATTVTVHALRFTSLLSGASYSMMSNAEEFRYLEDQAAAVWAGPAIALFLHGLFSVVTNGPKMGAAEMFQAVTSMELVGNALLRPEEVAEDDVRVILEQLQ